MHRPCVSWVSIVRGPVLPINAARGRGLLHFAQQSPSTRGGTVLRSRTVDKLKAMETLGHIADHGSRTAAARALDASLPSVVRPLAALERALQVHLFNRTTRRVALTDEGRQY